MPRDAAPKTIDSSTLARLTPRVLELAHEAGEHIMEVYRGDFSVARKADDSPLTHADLAAHEVLARGLVRLRPRLALLSEEDVVDYAQRRTWSTYWLVDPLDGTREFVKRNDDFTVNVALIDAHEPVLGVVHAPALEVSYYAWRGGGAWRAHGAQAAVGIHAAAAVRKPVRVAASRSHASQALQRFLQRLGEHELMSRGSSIKLCLVADGTVDVYVRYGPTSEWDIAAAQCVVEEGGGRVTDTRLSPLRYNVGESLLNPPFLVFGDTTKDWRALLG